MHRNSQIQYSIRNVWTTIADNAKMKKFVIRDKIPATHLKSRLVKIGRKSFGTEHKIVRIAPIKVRRAASAISEHLIRLSGGD